MSYTSAMQRDPLSHHDYEIPIEYSHSSRREPQGSRCDINDGVRATDRFGELNIDSRYTSIRSEHRGLRRTPHYVDDRSSQYPSTQSANLIKRRDSHYMDNVGSYYHSTHGGNPGKQTTDHHMDRRSSNNHSTHSKQPVKRSPHPHIIDEQKPRPRPLPKKASTKKELREQLFQQALQPFDQHSGTPYPCSQWDIEFHRRSKFTIRNTGPFVTVRAATKEVMWQNDSQRPIPAWESAAVARLLSAASSAQDGLTLGPDLAIKAFSDLDLVFFDGRLHDHVTVAWRANLTYTKHDRQSEAWGVCQRPRPGEKAQCRIQLNASLIFREAWTKLTPKPFESMIGTLLHEMCHAYEFVRCPHDEEPGDGHGKLFGTRISVVHKRALQILGLWAIEHGEKHKQHHFFMPGCLDSPRGASHRDNGASEESGDSGYSDGREKSAGGRQESNGKSGSSDKRNGGQRHESGKKTGRGTKAGGSSKPPKRIHEGTDCVIM